MNKATWRLIAISVIAVGLVGSCSKRKVSPTPAVIRPPDLSQCTRIEVKYSPSPLECLFPSKGEPNLLNEEEKTYLKSSDPIIVRDPDRIKAFAKEISSGSFEGIRNLPYGYVLASVYGYADEGQRVPLTVWDSTAMTGDGRTFHYSGENYPWRRGPLLGTLLALTPEIRAFDQRNVCARNIACVGYELRIHRPASSWCDDLIAHFRLEQRDEWIQKYLKCPAAPEGRCHHARNPECGPDSPPDTVLLFETKAGWNQHGGVELFTFDNHDPKGGCVRLNGGAVRFIRTEEELKQLRWK